MSAALSQAVYERLPIPLQNFICSAYGRREARARFGKDFDRHLDQLSQSEWWSAAAIGQHQDERLHELVRHAYETVPYYRDRMRDLGLAPSDIKTRADLPKLPRFADGWLLGKPDLIVKPDKPFVLPAQQDDAFRIFAIRIPIKQRSYVTGMDVGFRNFWFIGWNTGQNYRTLDDLDTRGGPPIVRPASR